jgi:group I intron endonuclease
MTAGVYLITHTVTGERYVGQSQTIEQRWKMHLSSLEKGKHHCKRMQELATEHGLESFEFEILEVLDKFPPYKYIGTLKYMEQQWIQQLNPELNLRGTEREGPHYQKTWTPERRKQHSVKIRAIWQEIKRQRQERKAKQDE